MKRMLINATQEEELRMAMVDGQSLYDLNIEPPASERKKANIYKGQITRIEPSLEAAFVSYGAERHGFLPLKEISAEYFVAEPSGSGKPNIRDVLREGQDIVVQIDKEERGNKGAALTTFVSLAGRFIVLKPNKPRSGGVSRRIVGEDRDLARQSMRDVEVPKNMSVILRTAGIERSSEELTWDIENLLAVWEAIKKVVVERETPFLIYRESNAVVRALRDYLTNEIGEILIDDDATYTEAREFVEQVMPHNLRKLKHYTDAVPLFTRYQIDSQIESAFAHSVNLPSGGSLVIDHTEALVSIDINSARATKGGDIEATALNTNLEAADEVARQLRLRDLGGLVVIDFIDMGPQRNQRDVENRLRDAVRQDRARVQLSKISRFGLLEMSRQRLRPSLGESSYQVCPRCSGIGNIRSVESLALAILRLVGEEARKERTAKVIAQLPIEVATYLLNEKRDWVQSLETRHDTQVILVANPALETPHYQVRRVRDDQVDLPENVGNSFMLAETESEPEITQTMQDKKPAEIAAVTTVVATTPAPPRSEPQPAEKSEPGLLSRIAGFFAPSAPEKATPKSQPRNRRGKSQSDSQRSDNQQNRKRADGQRKSSKKSSQRQSQTGKKRTRKKTAKDTDRQTERKSAQRGKAEQSTNPENTDNKQEENRPAANKRRSRGGRRRRRAGQDGAAKSDALENNAATAQNPTDSASDKKPAPAAQQSATRGDTATKDTAQVEKTNAGDSKTSAPTAKRKPARRPSRATQTVDKDVADTPSTAGDTKSATDKPGADKPLVDKPLVDKPLVDKPLVDKPKAVPNLTQVVTKKPAADKVPSAPSKPAASAPDSKPSDTGAKSAVVTPLTKVQTTSQSSNKPATPAPAPRAKKPPVSTSHEDTQPELTVIRPPGRPTSTAKAATTQSSTPKPAPKPAPAPRPKPAPAPKIASGTDAPKAPAKPVAADTQTSKEPAKSDKPAARLLPWDDGGSGAPGNTDKP